MSPAPLLRVAYVVPDLGIGGAERHVVTLMSRLDRERFAPSVICLGREGELFPALTESDVPAVALGHGRRDALACLLDLVRTLRRTSPDIVLVRGYNAEVLGRIAAVLARVPHVIVWVHNCGDLEPRGWVRRVCDAVLEPVTSAYFGVAYAQLPYLIDELHHPSNKVSIIHNGVDVEQFDDVDGGVARAGLGLGELDLVVGILAALRPEKDHETFLRSAVLVSNRLPRARFLIVGGGPRLPELKALAGELGVLDRVVFAGSRSDTPALLAAMDVFVLSSYTIECFPMALLEAMASSLPAVCTAVGGVPELVEEGVTGHLVPPRRPAELAERLLVLLSSDEQRKQFGAAARTRVETELSLDRSVRETERQLVAIAAEGAARAVAAPLRLTLVLDETFVGGVELLMLDVFKNFDPDIVRPRLICLRAGGPLAADYRDAGFDVEVLEHRGRFDPRTLPRLVEALRRDRTDVVLVTHHHRAALALGRAAALLARVPANVVAVHDMDLTRVGKRCLPRWAVETLRISDAIVLLSPSQGEYLHREEQVGRHLWSRTREVVIPNGVVPGPSVDAAARSAARAALGLGEGDYVVGIVARLSPQKAHHVLIQAFATLRERITAARLVIVGGGAREGELRSLTAELGLENDVLFTGIRRDVRTLMPAFDVSCLSSVHEGVPMAAIESMVLGIPMVATDCGALPDMIIDGEQGYIVPVGDSITMAERLIRLAEDRELRDRLGASARRRVEESYRLEQTAQGYENLLLDLVRRHRGRVRVAGPGWRV